MNRQDMADDRGEGAMGCESREAARLRQNIGRTRANMDQTVDEIQSRMTLDYITEQSMDLVRKGATNAASKVGQVVREHPLPTAVIGAGIVWMIMRARQKSRGDWETLAYDESNEYDYEASSYGEPGFESSKKGRARQSMANVRESAERMSRKAKDRLHNVGSGVKDTVSNVGGQIKDKVANIGGRVSEGVQNLGSQASHKFGEVSSQVGESLQQGARQTREWVDHTMDEYPLAVGAAFFTLGLATGVAVPSTEKEDELLGETRDRLINQAEEYGAELLHKGERLAESATQSVKQAVSQGAAQSYGGQQQSQGQQGQCDTTERHEEST